MGRQQNKTLEISSRQASLFLNFDEVSRLNPDRIGGRGFVVLQINF